MKTTKFWVIVIGAVLLLSSLAAVWLLQGKAGTVARIYQDGVCIRTIDLSTVTSGYSFTVETGAGGYNVVQVEQGRICVTEANCPDQVCVRQGWISNQAAPIACLPHKLIVEITDDPAADSGIDGVAQ